MSKRTIPSHRRDLKPRTHSIYCRVCGLNEQDCEFARTVGASIDHQFKKSTVAENEAMIAGFKDGSSKLKLQAIFAPLPALKQSNPDAFDELLCVYTDLFGEARSYGAKHRELMTA